MNQQVANLLEELEINGPDFWSPVTVNGNTVRAGDILIFHYMPRARLDKYHSPTTAGNLPDHGYPWPHDVRPWPMVLVVKARGGSGIYTSPRHQRLLACFMLNDVSPEVLSLILKNLYKNRGLSFGNITTGLAAITGSDFRSYNINHISTPIKLSVKKNEL